jgi:hypothetical protein
VATPPPQLRPPTLLLNGAARCLLRSFVKNVFSFGKKEE